MRRLTGLILCCVAISLGIGPFALSSVVQNTPDSRRRIHPISTLSTVTVSFGRTKIKAWLMDTESKRTEGMMYLSPSEVPSARGMLFVHPEVRQVGYWNQNVFFDLDVAYLDENGRVLNTVILKKQDPTSKPSKGIVKFVLEMRRGAFKRLGIRAGSRLGIPRNLKGS